jgi:hypothetical protein
MSGLYVRRNSYIRVLMPYRYKLKEEIIAATNVVIRLIEAAYEVTFA